jgi:hypothetical protein
LLPFGTKCQLGVPVREMKHESFESGLYRLVDRGHRICGA